MLLAVLGLLQLIRIVKMRPAANFRNPPPAAKKSSPGISNLKMLT
jgi:hypothetical protein